MPKSPSPLRTSPRHARYRLHRDAQHPRPATARVRQVRLGNAFSHHDRPDTARSFPQNFTGNFIRKLLPTTAKRLGFRSTFERVSDVIVTPKTHPALPAAGLAGPSPRAGERCSDPNAFPARASPRPGRVAYPQRSPQSLRPTPDSNKNPGSRLPGLP